LIKLFELLELRMGSVAWASV